MLPCTIANSLAQVQGLKQAVYTAGVNGHGPGPLAGLRRAVLNMLVRRPNAVTWTDMASWTVIAEWPEPAVARVRVRIVASGGAC